MLIKMKEGFISQTKEKSKLNYNRKIEIFIEYLQEVCGVNNQNYKETLRGIGSDKIIRSIEYYVHNYGIRYKSTVDNYVTAIKSFFNYLANNEKINNELFDSQAKASELDNLIKLKLDELKLNRTEMKEPLSKDDFDKLLKKCNHVIKDYNIEVYNNDGKNKVNTGLFISAIIMKLVMFTGIKNSVIPSILKNHYDIKLNKIKINGLWLNIPDELSYNLKKYYSVREEILKQSNINETEQKQLFIDAKGNYMEIGKSSDIYKVMKQELKTSEGERLCKYVIMEHINAGINVLEIMNLTTFSLDTCMHCKEELSTILNKKRDKYINVKLRSSYLYEIL